MKKVKSVFFDIDGTVYDGSKGSIPKSTIFALKALQANDIMIFLATGRSLPAVKESHLDQDISWDGYICSNGACLHDAHGTLLYGTFFKDKQIDELFTLAKTLTLDLVLQSPDQVFSPFEVSSTMRQAYSFFHIPVPIFLQYQKQPISMALAFQEPGFSYQVIDTINGLTAIEGKSNYADIIQKGVTKATGIAKIKDILKLNDYLCMAFGDADNDLEMIQYVDIGIAMGNATDAMKEKADFITTNIDSDGIYNALSHYGLI